MMSSTSYNGHRWSFFSRNPQNAPTIIVVNGVHSGCIRTAKMARIEAVLLVSDVALSAKRLAQLATLADVSEAKQLIEKLNLAYDLDRCAFRIEPVASGFRLLTRPAYSFWLGKLHQRQAELRLTPPALETLAIVAYRQPITRADVEKVRRVNCTDGEDDSLGRPFLYETTRQFLELFGLRSLDALPMAESLRKPRAVPMLSTESDGTESDANDSAG